MVIVYNIILYECCVKIIHNICALKHLREHKLIVFTEPAQHTQHNNLSMIQNKTQNDFLLSKLGYIFGIMISIITK